MLRDFAVQVPLLTAILLFCGAGASAQPPRTELRWVTEAVEAPGVEQHTFDSAAAGCPVSYHVYLPEDYGAEPERRFPVLYWLHGSRGGLPGIAPLSATFGAAMREGKMPPMIVVFPNGLRYTMWVGSRDGRVPMETIFVEELVPHIDATFRTIASREGRIVEGFSMGGYGALRFGMKYPELFRAASSFGGGPLQQELPKVRDEQRAGALQAVFGGDREYFRELSPWALTEQNAEAVTERGLLLRLAIGDEDNSLPINRRFSEHLTDLNVPHTFTVVPDVAHDTLGLLSGLGDEFWSFYKQATAEGEPRPAASQFGWVTEAVEAPGVEQRTFDSEAIGAAVSYHVSLPAQYEAESERRFPVLYWLHGGGGFTVRAIQTIAAHFGDAMEAGEIPPMIVVFPHVPPMSLWVNSKDGRRPLETMVIDELLPHIDETLRTVASREGRIVEGWSMGGYGAARFGLKRHDLFGAASSFAGGPLQKEFTHSPRTSDAGRERVLRRVCGGDHEYFRELSPWRLAEQNAEAVRDALLFRVVIGEEDEMIEVAHEFHVHLKELGIPHEFTVVPGAGHEPVRVLRALGEDGWAFYREALAGATPDD